MEFIQRKAPRNFNLFFLGDTHIGSDLFHERGFLSFIKMVQRPYAGARHNIVIGMGDFIEAIDTNDKRFDLDTVDKDKIRPELQMDFFVENMMEIRDSIAVLLQGNHEHKLMRYYDYVRSACRTLGVPYGTYTSVVTFRDRYKNTMLKVFVTHGMGQIGSNADSPERRDANMKLQMKRKLWNKAGDCVLMAFGHTHKILIAEPSSVLYLESTDERVVQKYTSVPTSGRWIPKDLRWYVNTGSLLRLYKAGVSGYAERAMYDPIELGYPVARIRKGEIVGIDKIIV